MRTLIAIVIVSLVATSTAFARKASHHHFKRAAPKHQSATKTGWHRTPSGRRRARSKDRKHLQGVLGGHGKGSITVDTMPAFC